MKHLLKQTFIPILIIGTFTCAISIILRSDPTYTIITLKSLQIGNYTWTYYDFNIQAYIHNIQTSLDASILRFVVPNIPTAPVFPAMTIDVWDNILSVLKFIASCLFFVINWIVFIINCTLIPIKIIFYPVRVIYSLLALNTTSYEFMEALSFILQIAIPFIPYII